jgi:hypothetical protein
MNDAHRIVGNAVMTLLITFAMSRTMWSSGPPLRAMKVEGRQHTLRGPVRNLTGAEVFAELLKHNRLRDAELRAYSSVRIYQVTSESGKLYAREVVRMHYLAPDHKKFSIASAEGSWLVRGVVLKRLIQSERRASSGRRYRDTSLKPANYSFKLLGVQNMGPYRCYVVEALPRRIDKRLFEGTIWIDTEDYGVVRIAGRPAGKLSFWIDSAHFVRQYERIGRFWFPWKDESIVHVRFAGTKVLTIVHKQYVVNGREAAAVQSVHLLKPALESGLRDQTLRNIGIGLFAPTNAKAKP